MFAEHIWWLIVAYLAFTLFGVWLGWELWGRRLKRCAPDAERWQWWRMRHFALCSMACAKASGLDLSRIYVTTPEQMDAVTDAARNKTQNAEVTGA